MSEITFPSEALPSIDWENPVTKQQKHSMLLSGATELVTGAEGQILDPTKANFDNGYLHCTYTGTVTDSGLQNIPVPDITGDFTWYIDLDLSTISSSPDFEVIAGIATNGFNDFRLFLRKLNTGSLILAVKTTNNTINYEITAGVAALQTTNKVLVTYNGSDLNVYVNKAYHGSVALTGDLDLSGDPTFSFCGMDGRSVKVQPAKFYMSTMWDRVLAEEEIDLVHSNPYALFETQETELEEYGLQWDNNAAALKQGITIPVSYNTGNDLTVEVTLAADMQDIYTAGGEPNSTRKLIDAGGSRDMRTNLQNKGWSVNTGTAYVNDVLVTDLTATGELSNAKKGDVIKFVATSYPSVKLGIGNDVDSTANSFSSLFISQVAVTDDDGFHLFDLNRTFGTIIKSETSDKTATLHNFPAAAGYVRAFGVSDGLEFDNFASQQMTASPWNPTALGFEFSINFIAGITTRNLLGSDHATGIYLRYDGGQLHCWYNNAKLMEAYTTSFVEGLEYTVRGVVNADGSSEVFINETSVATKPTGTLTLGSSAQDTTVGYTSFAPTAFSDFTVKSVTLNDSDNTNSRYYDLTRITNNISVPETINGQVGTLVNFNDVYVPERNKTLVAQRFAADETQYVTIPQMALFASTTWTIKFKNLRPSTTFPRQIGGDNYNWISIRLADVTLCIGNNTQYTANFDTPLESGITYEDITIDCVAGAVTFYVNGVANGTTTETRTSSTYVKDINRIKHAHTYYVGADNIYGGVELICATDHRYYNFSIEAGDTIIDTLNGNDGTVVGGSLRRIYDYTGYGELVGYRFNGNDVYAQLTSNVLLSGDFSIPMSFIYADKVNQPIFGASHNSSGSTVRIDDKTKLFLKAASAFFNVDLVNDLTVGRRYDWIFKRESGVVDIVDTDGVSVIVSTWSTSETFTIGAIGARNNDYLLCTLLAFGDYDLTTGDDTKFIDRIGGNDATITNAPTSGFMPVVEKYIFSIGSDGWQDYSTPQNFVDGVMNTQDVINEAIVYSFYPSESVSKNGTDGVVISFVGNTDKNAIQEQDSFGWGGGTTINKKGLFSCERLTLGSFNGNTTGAEVSIDSSLIDTNANNAVDCTYIENFTIKDSTVKGFGVLGIKGNSGNHAKVINTVVDGSDINSAIAYVVERAELTNTIVLKGGGFSSLNNCTGTGNFTDDNRATALGIGTGNIDFTNAFNADGTITEDFFNTNLKGAGWNNSDVCAWAVGSAVVVITAALSGTITPTSTEVGITDGGKTIIVTLTGDTWQSAGSAFDDQRQAIINGLTSAQSELLGWNNEVRDNELVTAVTRDSDTQITITLSAAINYDITATETITVTVPATALVTSTEDVVADGTFTITATATGFNIVWASNVNTLIGAM